jgi:hypothetical protein
MYTIIILLVIFTITIISLHYQKNNNIKNEQEKNLISFKTDIGAGIDDLKIQDIAHLHFKNLVIAFREKKIIGIFDNRMYSNYQCKVDKVKSQNNSFYIYLNCIKMDKYVSQLPIFIKVDEPIPKNIKIVNGANYLNFPEEKYNTFTHEYFEEQMRKIQGFPPKD